LPAPHAHVPRHAHAHTHPTHAHGACADTVYTTVACFFHQAYRLADAHPHQWDGIIYYRLRHHCNIWTMCRCKQTPPGRANITGSGVVGLNLTPPPHYLPHPPAPPHLYSGAPYRRRQPPAVLFDICSATSQIRDLPAARGHIAPPTLGSFCLPTTLRPYAYFSPAGLVLLGSGLVPVLDIPLKPEYDDLLGVESGHCRPGWA